MTNPDDWTSWLAANPPPCLQELVRHWGGYDHIPAEAWAEYDLACTRWESARLDRLLGSHTWTMAKDRKRKGARTPREAR